MKILTTLLTICFIISSATLSWSGVCVNQEGSHSFLETSTCHVQEQSGESNCFSLEKESLFPSTSGEECVDLFFSSEVNLTRFKLKVAAAVQLPLNRYALIASFPHQQKTTSAHTDHIFIPDKVLQIQRAVVLVI